MGPGQRVGLDQTRSDPDCYRCCGRPGCRRDAVLACVVGCACSFVGVNCVGVVGVLGRLGWVAVMVGLLVVLEWMCWLSAAVMKCP